MSLFRIGGGLNGSTFAVNESKYGHDTGMVIIAMESAQELYDIFCEGTLASEEAELEAATEGVVLEGSQYEVVQENAIKSAYGKVKAFLQKLWAKVKGFFKQVRMFLDKIFMAGKEFVVKYDKEIKEAAKNAKDFEFKMYKYDNSAIDDDVDAASDAEQIITEITNLVGTVVRGLAGDSADLDDATTIGSVDKTQVEGLKKSIEKSVGVARKDITGTEDEDEVSESLFKMFRNGATDENDKEDIKWDSEFVNVLKNGKTVSKIDTYASKIDSAYKKAIKAVDDAEKKASSLGDGAKAAGQAIAECLRELSSSVSKIQTISNQYMSAWKTAVNERSGAYKNCCYALMRHKNK